MIPVGYMYKSVVERPGWLGAPSVGDVYSVSRCVSTDFAEWIHAWKHNGFWFFNEPQTIVEIAKDKGASLDRLTLFFYWMYEKEWDSDDEQWHEISPNESFHTNVQIPEKLQKHGYDVVTYTSGNAAECSPLSCNHYASEFDTNNHCLLNTFDEAMRLVENGSFLKGEPGPYRILEVCTVETPDT